MIRLWDLNALSYDDVNPGTGGQYMEYMPIEPPYPIIEEELAY